MKRYRFMLRTSREAPYEQRDIWAESSTAAVSQLPPNVTWDFCACVEDSSVCYLTRESMKEERFMPQLALRLTGEARWKYSAGDRLTYLGAGYWRAQAVHAPDYTFLGHRLINPDYSELEIVTITKAMALLLGVQCCNLENEHDVPRTR